MKAPYDAFARFYDIEYGHKENDINFYIDMAEKYGDPVLEVGVGTGRIALPLIDEGFQVVGIDNSPRMLEIADQKRAEVSSELCPNLQLFTADMRSFDLNRDFSLVIIPFRGFLHNLTMKDQLATLRAISRHLKPGGHLVFDLFVPLFSVLSRDEWHERVEEDELAEQDSGVTIDIHVKHDPREQLLKIENVYNKGEEKHSARMAYRYVFRNEMELLLKCTGFEVSNVWGGFDYEPYNYHSGIMVFDAIKVEL